MNAHVRDNLSWLGRVGVDGWSAWTPELTASSSNPTLGSGSVQSGMYCQVGMLVVATAKIAFGSSGAAAGSGNYQLSLPVASGSDAATDIWIGHCNYFDSGANRYHFGIERNGSVSIMYQYNGGLVTAASPTTPAANDSYKYNLLYESAS